MKRFQDTKRLSDLTVHDCRDILAMMSRESYFFSCDWIQLGKHFLHIFLGSKIWSMTYADVLSFCKDLGMDIPAPCAGSVSPVVNDGILESVEITKHPENEQDFYKGLLGTFLSISKLPRDCKLECINKVSDMMKRLTSQKKICDDKVHELNGATNKFGETKYNLQLYKYYSEKNQAVINDIIDYLANGIEEDSLAAARMEQWVGRLDFWDLRTTDADISKLDFVVHNFGDFSIPGSFEVSQLYKRDKCKFFDSAHDFLLSMRIPEVKKIIKKSPWFSSRKDVLLEGLSLFKKGKFQVASAVLALQIEGLIQDVLVALGTVESSLSGESISSKARILAGKSIGFVFYYEYYAFRFPVLRNRIAHGEAHKTGREDAIQIALDLCGLCKYMAEDNEIPVNKLNALVSGFNFDTPDFKELLDYAIIKIENPELTIPESFLLGAKESQMDTLLQGKTFWEWMKNQTGNVGVDCQDSIGIAHKIGRRFKVEDMAKEFTEYCSGLIKKQKQQLDKILAALSNLSTSGHTTPES